MASASDAVFRLYLISNYITSLLNYQNRFIPIILEYKLNVPLLLSSSIAHIADIIAKDCCALLCCAASFFLRYSIILFCCSSVKLSNHSSYSLLLYHTTQFVYGLFLNWINHFHKAYQAISTPYLPNSLRVSKNSLTSAFWSSVKLLQ